MFVFKLKIKQNLPYHTTLNFNVIRSIITLIEKKPQKSVCAVDRRPIRCCDGQGVRCNAIDNPTCPVGKVEGISEPQPSQKGAGVSKSNWSGVRGTTAPSHYLRN